MSRRQQGETRAFRNIPALLLALAGLAGLIGITSRSVRSARAEQAPHPETIFGMQPGEMRRYVLGPPEQLDPGESAEWSFEFERFEYPEGDTVAVFLFTHDRLERLPGSYDPQRSMMEVIVEGRLYTNLAGFPLRVEYTQRFIIQGEETGNSGRRRVHYVFDPEHRRYVKTLEVGSHDWDFKFGIPKHKHLDLAVPRGLYVFLYGSLDCLGYSQVVCVELEPALANPGFLTMAMPSLEEMSDSEREFLFFMPTSLGASPFTPVVASDWLSRERNQFTNRERYFQSMKLKLEDSEEIQVGPRTMHAWKVDMCCGIKQVWVEPGGRVLRLDLDDSFEGPTGRQIRYLFPFEEFTSPNDDPVLRRKQR